MESAMVVVLPGAAFQCSEMVLVGHDGAALLTGEFSSVWDMGQHTGCQKIDNGPTQN